MDIEGIDVAVLYPTRALQVLSEPRMEPKFAAALARAYNDWLYDFCKTNPSRLLGAGMISPFDIDEAVAEAKRCATELGFRAVFMRSSIMEGRNWFDEYFEPLWATLEEYELPVGFHESSSSAARQTGDFFEPNFMLRRAVAQPMEQMLGLVSLCSGGVLARHPKLRAAFLEANCTWLPWLLWRLDEGWEREGDIWAQDLTMKPSEYFKKTMLRVGGARRGRRQVRNRLHRHRSAGILHGLSAWRFQISSCSRNFPRSANHRRRQTKNSLGQLRRVLSSRCIEVLELQIQTSLPHSPRATSIRTPVTLSVARRLWIFLAGDSVFETW